MTHSSRGSRGGIERKTVAQCERSAGSTVVLGCRSTCQRTLSKRLHSGSLGKTQDPLLAHIACRLDILVLLRDEPGHRHTPEYFNLILPGFAPISESPHSFVAASWIDCQATESILERPLWCQSPSRPWLRTSRSPQGHRIAEDRFGAVERRPIEAGACVINGAQIDLRVNSPSAKWL
jgi:hypothetical protein